MRNASYFMLKAAFVLEIFTIFSKIFGYAEKRLNKKVYDVRDGQQKITIHILPNISRSKGNKIWWEILFLKNHTQNVIERLVQDPFSEKSKLCTSPDQPEMI